jgi:AraC-like DNA-binding protein
MDFSTEFFGSLISSEANNRFSFSELFSDAYSRKYDFCKHLPHELCHKDVTVTSPFSYELDNLNALCIIHTTNGSGSLVLKGEGDTGQILELSKDTFALIDCRTYHKVVCRHNIWEFTICFIGTNVLEYYASKVIRTGRFIYRLERHPEIASTWQLILKNNIDDELHGISRSKQLLELFEQLYLARLKQANSRHHVPSYILELHKRFDKEYFYQYTLDDLSNEYGVNKFRLCREFAKYYSYTPIQYLNKVRIERAKDFLVGTDEKIVDIGQMVGIDNPNHFIRLFKEKTGVTPLTYRKETPVI